MICITSDQPGWHLITVLHPTHDYVLAIGQATTENVIGEIERLLNTARHYTRRPA